MFDDPPPIPDLPPPPSAGGGTGTIDLPPAPNPQAGYADSIQAWFRQYTGREATAADLQQYLGMPIQTVEQAIANSAEAKAYGDRNVPPTASPSPNVDPGAPSPTTVGNGAAPGANVGGLIQPFGTAFTAPPSSPYPDAPTFTPPTMGDAANDPGYQFSLDQGKRNLESWLSAHGTFNDSSAAEALQQFGQGAAATQYNNVWNRQYQGWQGALGPWQTNVGRIQHDNDMNWQNAFNAWLGQWGVFKDQRDSTFDKQYRVATA